MYPSCPQEEDKKWDCPIFNQKGYDPFIDFLKGVCIVNVVLQHCIPYNIRFRMLFSLWGESAVPLFLLLQVYHSYKGGLDYAKVKTNKLWERILKPFFLVQMIIIGISYFLSIGNISFVEFILNVLRQGGLGPGSYYPWIYIQMALIISWIAPILKGGNNKLMVFAFIIISECIEITCSLSEMPEWLYRLLFIRYFFLIYWGYMLSVKGSVLNRMTCIGSVLSAMAILYFRYSNVSLEPFFFNTNWKICHWICYIYFVCFFLYIIRFIYDFRFFPQTIRRLVEIMGRRSYEIFLWQMAYFCIMHGFLAESFYNRLGWKWGNMCLVVFSLVICTFPIIYDVVRKRNSRER